MLLISIQKNNNERELKIHSEEELCGGFVGTRFEGQYGLVSCEGTVRSWGSARY